MSESTEPVISVKPNHFWRTLIVQYLLTLILVGGLEAFCLMDWRSLFWAAILLAILRLHARFWGWLLPKRYHIFGILLGCWLILIPLAVLHFAIWAYWLNPIEISPSTTFITEPLTPDRKRVDFFAALEQRISPNLPPEENGFRLLVQEWGPTFALRYSSPLSKDHKATCLKLCDKLNLNSSEISANQPTFEPPSLRPLLKERENAVNPEPTHSDPEKLMAWIKALNEKERRLGELPWTADEFPEIALWIEKNNNAFDLLGKAVRMPVFFAPLLQYQQDDALERSYHQSYAWQISSHLPFRIQYYLGHGEREKAWYDIMTQYRFHFWREQFSYLPSQIWFLFPIEPATVFLQNGLAQGAFTSEDIRRYHDEIKPLLQPTTQNILDNQKFGGHLQTLDFMLRLTYSSSWNYSGIPRLFSWNQALQKINAHFDAAWQESLEKAALPNSHAMDSCHIHESNSNDWQWVRTIKWAWTIIWFGPFKLVPCRFANYILKSTEPSYLHCMWPMPLEGYDIRGLETRKALIDIAFELAQYKAEKGKYPLELQEIGQSHRRDPYSNEKYFHYQPHSQGGCSLYSVGPNGIDDQGVQDSENKKDDIVIQLP